MREAYFSVGEEVILKSKSYPECNGEAVVLDRDSIGNKVHPGTGVRHPSPWGYTLSIKSPSGNRWNETALRKKHQPGEKSLEDCLSIDSLMENTEGEFI